MKIGEKKLLFCSVFEACIFFSCFLRRRMAPFLSLCAPFSSIYLPFPLPPPPLIIFVELIKDWLGQVFGFSPQRTRFVCLFAWDASIELKERLLQLIFKQCNNVGLTYNVLHWYIARKKERGGRYSHQSLWRRGVFWRRSLSFLVSFDFGSVWEREEKKRNIRKRLTNQTACSRKFSEVDTQRGCYSRNRNGFSEWRSLFCSVLERVHLYILNTFTQLFTLATIYVFIYLDM